MKDTPRHVLREIILNNDIDLWKYPNQVEGLLRDYCPSYKKEIFLLMGVLKNGFVEQLLNKNKYVNIDILVEKLISSAQENLGLSHESSRYAVQCWAWALGYTKECNDLNQCKNIRSNYHYNTNVSYRYVIGAYNKAMEIRG